jgi:hypothetical protein
MNSMPILCLGCLRYNPDGKETCDAYPNGIPEAILNGASHFDPDPETGDGGLAFDADPEAGEYIKQYIAFWYELEGSDQLSV